MRPRRIVSIIIASGGLGFGCLSLLAGCADETKTTGTQLQFSEKDKAEIEEMRAAMKGHRAEQKQEQVEDRKKRK